MRVTLAGRGAPRGRGPVPRPGDARPPRLLRPRRHRRRVPAPARSTGRWSPRTASPRSGPCGPATARSRHWPPRTDGEPERSRRVAAPAARRRPRRGRGRRGAAQHHAATPAGPGRPGHPVPWPGSSTSRRARRCRPRSRSRAWTRSPTRGTPTPDRRRHRARGDRSRHLPLALARAVDQPRYTADMRLDPDPSPADLARSARAVEAFERLLYDPGALCAPASATPSPTGSPRRSSPRRRRSSTAPVVPPTRRGSRSRPSCGPRRCSPSCWWWSRSRCSPRAAPSSTRPSPRSASPPPSGSAVAAARGAARRGCWPCRSGSRWRGPTSRSSAHPVSRTPAARWVRPRCAAGSRSSWC